jgi:hypothetical protein
MIRFLFIVLVIAVVVILVLRGVFSSAVFRIRVAGRDLLLQGNIPGRSWSEVRDFLRSLNLPPGTVITGYPDASRFRLEFGRHLDEGTRQRIRNFLYLP